MKKLEITYRNLQCVPNEIILGIYNCLHDTESIVTAIDSIIAIKNKHAQEMKEQFAKYLEKGKHSVDDIKSRKKLLYIEYRNKIRQLETVVSASINFYRNLDQLYDGKIVDELCAGKPFELSRPNNTTDRFLVTNGNLIYVNEGISGARSGFLYTEYDCEEIIDTLIYQMYEENNITKLTKETFTQEENE